MSVSPPPPPPPAPVSAPGATSTGNRKPRHQQTDKPIVFAPPLQSLPVGPPTYLLPDGDVIVDPFGAQFCFVCNVSVPLGKQNVEQHLLGKRHSTNNGRISQADKPTVRQRYVDAVKEQKKLLEQQKEETNPSDNNPALATAPAPTAPKSKNATSPKTTEATTEQPETTSQPDEISVQPSSSKANAQNIKNHPSSVQKDSKKLAQQPSNLTNSASKAQHTTESTNRNGQKEVLSAEDHANPKAQTRQERVLEKKKKAEALLEAITIDKQSFISGLLAASDSEEEENNEMTGSVIDAEDNPAKIKNKSGVQDNTEKNENHSAKPSKAVTEMENYEGRRLSVGTMNYKGPEGPDYFFESMAPETKRTHIAAKIRENFKAASTILKQNQITAGEDKQSEEKGRLVSDGSDIQENTALETSDFIPCTVDDEKEEQKREKELQVKRDMEQNIVLRDVNGEILPPWLLNRDAIDNILYSADSSIALHFEILQFTKFMSPTQLETQARKEMIMTVETIAKKLWPECTSDVFGSYATGLALPSSDVDVCIMNTPGKGQTMEEFETLAEAVRTVDGFAKRVQVVKAKVPLVKIISRKTSMNCDVSIGVDNGVNNVPRIKLYIEQFPALRPLLLVVKCFLSQKSLNEVYTGGLGSYTLLLMVVSHLQMLSYNFPRAKPNLGMQLQSFFELYGRMFNFALVGIQIRDGGKYLKKLERYPVVAGQVLRFVVEDPNDVDNELGKNGFAAGRVRSSFTHASRLLVEWRRDDGGKSPTPLGDIINVPIEFAKRRRAVIEDMERRHEPSVREYVDEERSRRDERRAQSNSAGYKDSGGGREGYSNGGSRRRTISPERKRDRDPRLGKRRRSSGGDRSERSSEMDIDMGLGMESTSNAAEHFPMQNNAVGGGYPCNQDQNSNDYVKYRGHRRGGRPTY